MKIASNWKDFKVIATSNGEKLEQWDKYFVLRPDPQVIWKNDINLFYTNTWYNSICT